MDYRATHVEHALEPPRIANDFTRARRHIQHGARIVVERIQKQRSMLIERSGHRPLIDVHTSLEAVRRRADRQSAASSEISDGCPAALRGDFTQDATVVGEDHTRLRAILWMNDVSRSSLNHADSHCTRSADITKRVAHLDPL